MMTQKDRQAMKNLRESEKLNKIPTHNNILLIAGKKPTCNRNL